MNEQWSSVCRRDRSVNRVLLATLVVIVLSAAAARLCLGGEREAVVLLDGCTGFVVDDDLLVTAKHCEHPATLAVRLQGKQTTARRVYVAAGEDGPDVFRLEGGPYECLPVAPEKPRIGDRVYSLGYPGGNWARIEGEIVGGNGKDVNFTNQRIATGNSGGPLLNERGEVIGVALFVATDVSVHRSGFAGWQVTTEAIRQAQLKSGKTPQRYSRRPVVIVFSSEGCGPCRQLAQDVQAGHFDGYEFQFVHWNDQSGQWSEPDVYREFVTQCRPDAQGRGFPTIWVRGTDQYRVGYATERRGGLLGWLAAAAKHLIEALIGREQQPEFPNLDLPPSSAQPGGQGADSSATPDELLLRLVKDLAALRDEAVKTKADLAEFKESGVVGKIRTLARLKSDKDEALERVEAVKSDVAELRGRFREDPLGFLWGLFGLASGLIHRRFA